MKHVLDIVAALENEIVVLETRLAPNEAHIARIKALIEDLKPSRIGLAARLNWTLEQDRAR